MKEAIKLAQSVGYDPIGRFHPDIRDYACPLDVEFWQALGKALKWNDEKISFKVPKRKVETYRGTIIRAAHIVTRTRYNRGTKSAWKNKMRAFMEHIIEGKYAESFFTELLCKK